MALQKSCMDGTNLLSSSVMTETSSCEHSTAQHGTAWRHGRDGRDGSMAQHAPYHNDGRACITRTCILPSTL
jgi:hypothetical protein